MNLDFSTTSGLTTHVDRPLVLAADDDEDNLLLLVYALNLFGYTCISTLRGEMVLQLAHCYKPNLILLDVVFPDLNGIEVIERLKQDVVTRSIPVIAVTALAQADDRERLLNAGCKGYVDKPYDLDDLEVMLRQFLTPMPSIS
ncbi:response regulator [Oscillatoria sp. FACHB-1407]|uniref:response regulator n=1 Tax=Oscillatoria sp. FACHB-1407 TaxID=2692847 RepID=UPI001689D8DA|nr:response regulator [Oscillatoria sp. FACHB-1407]MBD2463778.1 response regulator [Oscillatoria sp. FACHB-1407]